MTWSRWVSIALLVLISSTDASAQALNWLMKLGRNGAARSAIAALAESSPAAARAALGKLGIATASEADALSRIGTLSDAQVGALLLHDSNLGSRYLSQFSSDTRELKLQMGYYNLLRSNQAHRNLIAEDTTADSKRLFAWDPKKEKIVDPATSAFRADVGTGRITLERPIVLCNTRYCNLKLEEFNGYAALSAGGAAGCLSISCYERLKKLFAKGLEE